MKLRAARDDRCGCGRDPVDRHRRGECSGGGAGRRRSRVSRALQGTGRDQHDALGRQLHAGRRGDAEAPARGRDTGRGHADPRAAGGAERRRAGRRAAGPGPLGQADPPARAHRRRRGEARGLEARSLQAGGRGRLVLRARRQRRQVDGRDLHGQPHPLQEGRLHAAARHQARADLRRGNGGRRASSTACAGWCRRGPKCSTRRSRSTRARAASTTRTASRSPCRSRRARRSTRISRSRRRMRAATARARRGSTPSCA